MLVKSNVAHVILQQPVLVKEKKPRSFGSKELVWLVVGVLGVVGGLWYFGLHLKLHYLTQPLYVSIDHLAKERSGERI